LSYFGKRRPDIDGYRHGGEREPCPSQCYIIINSLTEDSGSLEQRGWTIKDGRSFRSFFTTLTIVYLSVGESKLNWIELNSWKCRGLVILDHAIDR